MAIGFRLRSLYRGGSQGCQTSCPFFSLKSRLLWGMDFRPDSFKITHDTLSFRVELVESVGPEKPPALDPNKPHTAGSFDPVV